MREIEESYTCPSCNTKMDIVLKPEPKGRCAYCNYIKVMDMRIGKSGSHGKRDW